MIKLTNASGKKIDISESVSIQPNSFVTGDIELTPRIQQLINMGLITMSDTIADVANENNNNESYVSTGALRRKQVMEKIKAGYSKPSIALDAVNREPVKDVKMKTNKRNKNK